MAGMDRRKFLETVGRAGFATWTLGSMPEWARAAATATAKTPPTPAELIKRNAWPEHFETTLAALGRSWTTRDDRFFVRSHLPVLSVDPATWRLEITGLVANPVTLSLADLKATPSTEAPITLACAGNGRAL